MNQQKSSHQENMSVKSKPPQTPLLYSKTGVCRGISIFLIFAPKHRLWVLVRTASHRGGSNVYPQSMFLAKIRKIFKKNAMKFSIFTGEKNLCILHGQVFIMLQRMVINKYTTYDVIMINK